MDSELDLGYLLAVSAAAVWTPRPLASCLAAFGDARTIIRYARGELVAATDCEPLHLDALARIASIDDEAARDALAAAQARGHNFVTQSSDNFPARLGHLCDPPPVLYYVGDLTALSRRTVAIVGSRAATPYGRSIAEEMASDFAALGISVVSGLARGIDAAAHRGCVRGLSPTVAVIGSGLDALYPPYHAKLSDEIVRCGGAILTEFPPRMSARPHHFPMRNRLVAALADATVVVEASFKSGALITARLAAELGRSVFAVPGDVGRPASEGTNALIKDGAILTTSAADMCAVLGWPLTTQSVSHNNELLADPIACALSHSPANAEEISRSTGIEISAVLAHLTILEIQGRAERHAGGFYSAVSARKAANARPS